ncbi:MAG TPA: DUF1365 domain-containing protein [Solirubrobacteraceae bacterium]
MSASCIYEGTIRHRRFDPRREFSHRLALAYLDLDELPGLLGGRLLARRPGLVRFRRRDYLGDNSVPLDGAVRDVVERHTAARPTGPIRLLTHPRSFGHCFNPVSFYYCLEPGGERVQALVTEVTNTPWGERHAYVLEAEQGRPGLDAQFDKALHVSPFMGMDHRYEIRAGAPAQTLSVHIASRRADATVFDATLALRRRELTRASMARVTARYPLATVRVLALIYAHAVGLKLAGVPVHAHPQAGRL